MGKESILEGAGELIARPAQLWESKSYRAESGDEVLWVIGDGPETFL